MRAQCVFVLQRFCNGAVERCRALLCKLATIGLLKNKIKQQLILRDLATNQGVVGSNPAGRANYIKGLQTCRPFLLGEDHGELATCPPPGGVLYDNLNVPPQAGQTFDQLPFRDSTELPAQQGGDLGLSQA